MGKSNFDKYLEPKKKTVKVVIYQLPEAHNEFLKRAAKDRGVTVQKVLLAMIRSLVEGG